jgi:xanthine phosphoribosyltransferase
MARELGIRFVDTICISSYDHANQRDLQVLKKVDGDGEGFWSSTIWSIAAIPPG